MTRLTVGEENGHPIQLYFEDKGAGQPVVLVHGWPLSGRSWEKQVPALIDAGYRAITYDRRGFGWSSQPWGGYDYDTFAADLNALITHLDLRDVVLVGFSMGGGEVVRYLSSYGTDRISKAVLAAAVPPFMHKTAENPDGALDDATIASFENFVRGDRPAFLNDFMTTFFRAGKKTNLVSEMDREYHRDIAMFASPKGTLDCIAAFSKTDFRDDVAKIDVPLLVIHGDSDAIVPFESSGHRVLDLVQGSQHHLILGGPHGLNLSHALEFNKALLDFLAS